MATCYLPDDEVFALREHLRVRADLVRLQTMIKYRILAVLYPRSILRPKGAFTAACRSWLAEMELDEPGRSVLGRFLSLLNLPERVKQSNGQLRVVGPRPRRAKPLAVVQTMPGVGLVTGLTVLAELGDLQRFQGA